MNGQNGINKSKINVVGYPRSGNSFLNSIFQQLYFPDLEKSKPQHAINCMNNKTHTFVPIRNPEECIPSWNAYNNLELNNRATHNIESLLISDINFYLRLNKHFIKNDNIVTFLNFDIFKNDLEYVKNITSNKLNIQTVNEISINDIKNKMLNDGEFRNLPRNNKDEIEQRKLILLSIPEYQNCLNLYNYIKNSYLQ